MIIEKLRTLWDDHAKAVYAYLLHLTRNEADASDFLQDLFSRLARQPELLDKLGGEPRGYLLRLARNLVVDQVRRHQARDRVFEKISALRPAQFIEAEDPDHPLLQNALADALAQLPLAQREVVHARLWKKQTLEAISSELGISINTAASRYRYAIDKMREHLRYLYEDLVPKAAQNPTPAMNQKPRNPFHRFDPEEPIIQPLEARRVPSATGAGFALPILPMPEDHSHGEETADHGEALAEHVEHDIHQEPHNGIHSNPHFEHIELLFDEHDSRFDDAHLAAFLDVDTANVQLPFTFDHVMQTLDNETENAPASGDHHDILWPINKIDTKPVYEPLQWNNGHVLTRPLTTTTPPVIDDHSGEANPGHETTPPEKPADETSVVLTENGGSVPSSLNVSVMNAGSFVVATVNDNGVLRVVVSDADHEGVQAGQAASESVSEVVDSHQVMALRIRAQDSESDSSESDSSEHAAEKDHEHAPLAAHETIVIAPAAATPSVFTVIAKDSPAQSGIQINDFQQIDTFDQQSENARIELIDPSFHEAGLFEPAPSFSGHDHSAANHEFISIDLSTPPGAVESYAVDFDHDPATVHQWVPVQDNDEDDHSPPVISDGLDSHAIGNGDLQIEGHSLHVADAGAWTTPPIRGNVNANAVAMAATGAVLLSSSETGSRKREEQE